VSGIEDPVAQHTRTNVIGIKLIILYAIIN